MPEITLLYPKIYSETNNQTIFGARIASDLSQHVKLILKKANQVYLKRLVKYFEK